VFTGIVEEVGRVHSMSVAGNKARLVVRASRVLDGTKPGDSINIDGACQTVTAIDVSAGTFSVDTLAETLKKTTLGSLRAGCAVNLERALTPETRMGGHIVQGHVSCTAKILELRETGGNVYLTVGVPAEYVRYCVAEGSVALDGISLTVARIEGSAVSVNVIPTTLRETSLGGKKAGDAVNLETDIIGRYVERLLTSGAGSSAGGLSFERLRELGF
jgi:riboflavin synthase